ncbi:MAG: chromate transporter [Chitinophagaceae bacterium]
MQKHKSKLSDIAKLFVKLGVIGFGGPAVHIAMMEEEVVTKEKVDVSHTFWIL